MAERTPLRIVPTFLGAHLIPEPDYLDLLVEEMLPGLRAAGRELRRLLRRRAP